MPEIFQLLINAQSSWPPEHRYDALMLWAMVCTGFFGFMRAGEFMSITWAYNPHMLRPQDMSVDSHLKLRLCMFGYVIQKMTHLPQGSQHA